MIDSPLRVAIDPYIEPLVFSTFKVTQNLVNDSVYEDKNLYVVPKLCKYSLKSGPVAH